MQPHPDFENRRFEVALWDLEPKFVNNAKVNFEKALSRRFQTHISAIESMTELTSTDQAFDLLAVLAPEMESLTFRAWIHKVIGAMSTPTTIWTPAIIISKASFEDIASILPMIVAENWYFDLVHPDHFESLPIRFANLVRIHDHLLELRRYHERLASLENSVRHLKDKLGD